MAFSIIPAMCANCFTAGDFPCNVPAAITRPAVWVYEARGGNPSWNYTPSASILVRQVFIWLDSTGAAKLRLRKKFSRTQLLHFTASLKVDLIGMEACGEAHFLGHVLREQGHAVGLMPAQYVKP